jgi:hypothetical protein
MKRTDFNIIWGILLIAAGVLFLLQTLSIIDMGSAWEALWGIVFAISGLAFAWRFLIDRTGSWWAIIPGCTLLALAGLVGLHTLGFVDNGGPWLGALFLGVIGASFWAIYLVHREYWWAVIPGGVLFTVAAVALSSNWIGGEAIGGILFLGLASTFGLVSILPTPHGRMVWALIPAGVLGLMGLALLLALTSIFNCAWALVLILVGVYLLFRPRGGGEITGRS